MSRQLINRTAHRVLNTPTTSTAAMRLASRQLPYLPWTVAQRGLADDADASSGSRSVQQHQHRNRGGMQQRRHGLPSTRRMLSSPLDMMMEAFENDLDDMFSDRSMSPFFGGRRGGFMMPKGLEEWVPKVNIAETDSSIHVHAELPGVKKEDIKLEVDEDGLLVIRGERKQEKKEEDKDKKYTRIESSFGSFERRIPLPEGVSQDQIKAKFNDGVLEVDVPRPSPPARQANAITIE